MGFYVKHPCVKSIHRSNKKSTEKYYFSILVLKSSTFQHPFQCWKVELFSTNIERHWFSILLFLVGKSRPFHLSQRTGKVDSFIAELQKSKFCHFICKFWWKILTPKVHNYGTLHSYGCKQTLILFRNAHIQVNYDFKHSGWLIWC